MAGDLQYSSYRSVKGEWFQQIPAHWEVKCLKRLVQVNPTGERAKKEETVTFLPMEAVSTNGLFDGSRIGRRMSYPDSLTEFQCGDVILAKITPCFENGKGAYLESLQTRKGIGSTEFHVFRPDNDLLLPRFLYYLTTNGDLRNYATAFMEGSAGQKRVTTPFVANCKFPVPPKEEQQRIATFLDQKTVEIDEAINKKRRLIELLQEQKTILINHAVTKGLNPNVPMRDSGVEWVGEVPEHWEVNRISWLFCEKDETGYPDLPLLVVSLNTGVTLRDMDDENHRQVASDYKIYKRALSGDIAFNKMRMWQGAVGVVPEDGLVSPDYVVARPVVDINVYYFEYLFRTEQGKAEFLRKSHGIVMDRNRLYWEDFKSIHVPQPPRREQDEICMYIQSLDKETAKVADAISREIATLEEYKSVLISNAVTGKIKV